MRRQAFRLAAPLLCALALSTGAPKPAMAIGGALTEMRQGDWAGAMIAARRDGEVGLDLIRWHHLRAGLGDADEVMDFLARNPNWPGLEYLREKSEAAITEASHEDVLEFFAGTVPQTGAGALSLARALIANAELGAAEAEIVLAWRTLALSREEQAAFLDQHGALLEEHHAARLDMALWRGWTANATAMLPLVDADRRKLAEARLALQAQAPGVDARIAAVPASLADDAGLARDRFQWRYEKRRREDATELLLERSTSAEALGEPATWARARRSLAREAMRADDTDLAYRIASTHFLVEGSDFADLEWLSGYLALRYLDDPELAAEHFLRFGAAVDTPISLGRAGYWLGRAEEAAGNAEAAQAAYHLGGAYQTSFYGLLAAERGGLESDPNLAGDVPGDWRDAAWAESSVYQAARLLLEAGEANLAERFLTHLAESQDRQGVAQIGAMLAELERPHIQVMVGKRAARFGIEAHGPYYPLHPLIDRDFPVPTELVLAIARRESEFDPVVVSGAGARGLMQLMPRTAQAVAGWLDMPYAPAKLTSDPSYNATLGARYLADLAETFDGNVIMMAAGYNAGPSRPTGWMQLNGDPRRGDIDIVDWIEHIPFNETRNYVMRVAESLPVYRARLGLDPHPVPFSEELVGSTLRRIDG